MPLERYEKRDVVAAAVKITRAGDGLSDAMELAPELLHYGETVYFVLRCEVAQIGYKPLPKGNGALVRVHTAEAREIARVAEADVAALLDAEAERIEGLRRAEQERADRAEEERLAAEEAAAGVQRLPVGKSAP